jgi:hypothetical protein
MILTHGKKDVSVVAQAWADKKGEETLSYCLHQSVLADVQEMYQPLGESIANRKIEKGKGVKSSGTVRAKKSREIVLQDPDLERDWNV